MTLKYNFAEDDLLCWYRYQYGSSTFARSQRKQVLIVYPLIFFGLAAAWSLWSQSWFSVFSSFGIAVALSFLSLAFFKLQVEQSLQAGAADPRVAGSFGPHQLTLSSEGLREITPVTDSLAVWKSIEDVVIEGNHVFVLLASGQAAAISRQSYAGPVPFEEIPTVIRDWKQKHSA